MLTLVIVSLYVLLDVLKDCSIRLGSFLRFGFWLCIKELGIIQNRKLVVVISLVRIRVRTRKQHIVTYSRY